MIIIKQIFNGYRRIKDTLFGQTCRFYPSCSYYAEGAIEKYGLFKGAYLTIRRLFKCHQLNPGGFDPVP